MAFAYGGDQYKDLWNSTLSYYSSKLIDMLPRSNPLLSKIAGNNNIKAKTLKGKRFVEPILARAVEEVQGISYRSPIDTREQQLIEMIEVEPKLCYQGVTVYDKEISVNNSNELIDLLSINQKAVREGFARAFAKGIYATGAPVGTAAAYDMNGLAYMISENPYVTDLVVYNLRRGLTSDADNSAPGGKYEFWRNRCGQWVKKASPANEMEWGTGTDTATKDANARKLINSMTMMLLVLNGVSEVATAEKISPVIDGIYMNYMFYNIFQYARYQLLHINNVNEQKVDVGFVKLEHMGVPVYLDKNCPMNKIYFVDSSQIDLLYIPGENFKQDVKEIPTQFAKRYITSFMGNYIIHKARNCGVLTLNDTDNGLNATTPVDLTKVNVCNTEGYQDYDYQKDDQSYGPEVHDSIEQEGYSGSGVKKDENPIPVNRLDASKKKK